MESELSTEINRKMHENHKSVGLMAVIALVGFAIAVPHLTEGLGEAPAADTSPEESSPPSVVEKTQLWMERVNNLSHLSRESDLVVVGHATTVGEASWNTPDGAAPEQVGPEDTAYHTVRFKVERVLRGESSSAVSVRVEGGTVGDVTVNAVSAPQFETGERTVLFLTAIDSEYGGYKVTDMEHGKLSIENGVIRREVPEGYTERIELGSLSELVQ